MGIATTQAQWNWTNNPNIYPPVPLSYPNGGIPNSVTKTGLLPADLDEFCGVPLQLYNTIPPTPMTDAQKNGILRSAEDYVEQNSGILLCTTWVASPPLTTQVLQASNSVIVPAGNIANGQVKGVDYDLAESGYDFLYRRWLAEGWGATQLRYRPLQQVYYMSFIYPLLNQVFIIPNTWVVPDLDGGFVRIVPTANVQVLPLFALELTFTGFANSIPQALYLQYTAGLTSSDYASRFAFMKTLVLAHAGILALQSVQGTLNLGATRSATSVDGLRTEVSYPSSGQAFGGLITQFTKQRDELMTTAIDLVRGSPAMFSL